MVSLGAFSLAAVVVLAGVRLASGERPPAAPGPVARGVAQRPAQESAPANVVTSTTVFRYRTLYEGCAEEREGSGPAPVGLVGLGRAAVQRAFPAARVVAFSPREVLLVETRGGCVPSGVTLLLRDGAVVVYYGRPGDLGGVYRITRLRAADLSPRDRDRLATGVVYATAAEADRAIAALGGGTPGTGHSPGTDAGGACHGRRQSTCREGG
jgi:hypothetical protein